MSPNPSTFNLTSHEDLYRAGERLAQRAQDDPSLLVDRALGWVCAQHHNQILRLAMQLGWCVVDLSSGCLPPNRIESTEAMRLQLEIASVSREVAFDRFVEAYGPGRTSDEIRAAARAPRTMGTAQPDAALVTEWLAELEATLRHYLDLPWRRLS